MLMIDTASLLIQMVSPLIKMFVSFLTQVTLPLLSQTTQQQLMISSEPSEKESWDKWCWTEPIFYERNLR